LVQQRLQQGCVTDGAADPSRQVALQSPAGQWST